MPISAVDSITLAFQHTKRQLFDRFRFGQWTRLAFVGLLAGELGSSGSFNLPSNFNSAQHGGSHPLGQVFPKIDPALLAGLIGTIVITGLVLMLVFTYINSVMRFILFDSVLTKECHVREGWNRRQAAGWSLFLWQIGYLLVTGVTGAVLFGIPALLAFSAGWFRHPHDHILGLVVGGIVMFVLLLVFWVTAAVIHVMTKDFVVPQMALEGISAVEGWRQLWQMLQMETGAYAGYIGMKVALAIGAGIVVTIASVILGIMVAIPVIGVAVATIVAGKAAGLTWNAFTITAAVVGACVLFAVFMYLIAMVSVPIVVFFPAYAMYFFAPRYRTLSLALYPPPVSAVPSPPPPDLPPAPAPA